MSLDQQDFESKKQALIDQFLLNEKIESGEERDKAFEELCIELLKLQYGITEISEEQQKKLAQYAKEKMSQMECEAPGLAHAVNGLTRIGKSRYGDASKYLEDHEKDRKKDFSNLQTERATKERPNSLNDLIKSYLRYTPDITDKDVESRLRADIGKGVVDSVDQENIYYFPRLKEEEITVEVKISGLKNRLNRLKKASN